MGGGSVSVDANRFMFTPLIRFRAAQRVWSWPPAPGRTTRCAGAPWTTRHGIRMLCAASSRSTASASRSSTPARAARRASCATPTPTERRPSSYPGSTRSCGPPSPCAKGRCTSSGTTRPLSRRGSREPWSPPCAPPWKSTPREPRGPLSHEAHAGPGAPAPGPSVLAGRLHCRPLPAYPPSVSMSVVRPRLHAPNQRLHPSRQHRSCHRMTSCYCRTTSCCRSRRRNHRRKNRTASRHSRHPRRTRTNRWTRCQHLLSLMPHPYRCSSATPRTPAAPPAVPGRRPAEIVPGTPPSPTHEPGTQHSHRQHGNGHHAQSSHDHFPAPPRVRRTAVRTMPPPWRLHSLLEQPKRFSH